MTGQRSRRRCHMLALVSRAAANQGRGRPAPAPCPSPAAALQHSSSACQHCHRPCPVPPHSTRQANPPSPAGAQHAPLAAARYRLNLSRRGWPGGRAIALLRPQSGRGGRAGAQRTRCGMFRQDTPRPVESRRLRSQKEIRKCRNASRLGFMLTQHAAASRAAQASTAVARPVLTERNMRPLQLFAAAHREASP